MTEPTKTTQKTAFRYPCLYPTGWSGGQGLFSWMCFDPEIGSLEYKEVDWRNATPEDMEKWRQEFVRLGL